MSESAPRAAALDEYQLEIRSLRQQLEHLRETEADLEVIDEYEAEVRNLTALYRAASATLAAGDEDPRLRSALAQLGFGDWSLTNVYSFVYDLSMELPTGRGRDLASTIDDTDYVGSLLEALSE